MPAIAETQSIPVKEENAPSLWIAALTLGALGLCWATLWNALRIDWDTNAEYAYGWSVPVTAFCIFFMRWERRPDPVPIKLWARNLISFALVLLVLAHSPLRFLEEANAEWRSAFWMREFQCVLLSLGWLVLVGGWKWGRHFAFPILFTATAVPWPRAIEEAVIQALTGFVTGASVEGLIWLGIPALQSGNVIELSNGPVGVSDACSGIRSLQICLMLSLLAGELWNLSLKRRSLLVLSGCGISFLFNIARTLSLCGIAVSGGVTAFNHWHDTLGALEMGGCIVAVLLAAWLLSPRSSTSLATIARLPARSWRSLILPIWLPVLMLSVWLIAELGTQYWYGSHEAHLSMAQRWNVPMPNAGADDRFIAFEKLEIPEASRAILRTNDGISFRWKEEDGLGWQTAFIQWPAGRSSVAAASMHHPDVCLSAAGNHFDREEDPVNVTVHGIPMMFHHYVFNSSTKPIHVFYSLSEIGTESYKNFDAFDLTVTGRINAAFAGRRNPGQTVLELLTFGAESSDAAVKALPSVLEKLVHPLPLT